MKKIYIVSIEFDNKSHAEDVQEELLQRFDSVVLTEKETDEEQQKLPSQDF